MSLLFDKVERLEFTCQLRLDLVRPVLPTTSSSPSASSVAGSGIAPSITHRLDSYFVLMKFSIFLIAAI